VPPVAARDWLYAELTMPPGKVAVETARGAGRVAAVMSMESALVAVAAAESVTRTVKLDVPAAVGVPLITPAALRVSPAGRVPIATAHV